MASMFPISTPRVGCDAIVNEGSSDNSLATTTFCWFPPERDLTFKDTFGALMSKSSLNLLACSPTFFKLKIPLLDNGFLKYEFQIRFSQILNWVLSPVFVLSLGI